MKHEIRQGTIRIVSNYARLLTTLGFGLLVVPLTLRWLGDDAFGMISLLGANIGLAGIFRQIIQMSLVRELGHAYHSENGAAFRRSYATICLITLICAFLSLLSFTAVFLLIPYFQIPPQYVVAARWFVFGQGIYTATLVLTAPMFNMYLVKEKFIEYNLWYILVRTSNLLAVILLGYVFTIEDPAKGLALLGITWASIASTVLVLASAMIVIRDRRLIPTLRGADAESRTQVVSTFSWNTAVQVAMNLHEQIPPLLLNLFNGTLANAAWGIGFRFVAYIRMCTTGVQFGSDAVSARLASGLDSEESRRQIQRLLSVQTKLTAMIALPAAVGIVVFGWPIFDLWVGGSLKDYETVMSIAVYMSKILAIGLASRAISDTWLLILYGAGFVRAYAPWVFAGGLIAPLASLVLMFTLPEHLVIYAPPVMFSLILFSVHLMGLPIICGRCLHIHPGALLKALLRPFQAVMIAAIAAILVLYFFSDIGDLGFAVQITKERAQQIDRPVMLISLLVFCVVYSLSALTIVMTKAERQRVLGIITRRVHRSNQG